MTDNNLIIGDFNFVENNMDKARGMNQTDKMIHTFWETFTSEIGIVDHFRIQYPKKKLYSYFVPTGRSRGFTWMKIKNISSIKYINSPFNSAQKILTFDFNEVQKMGPGYWKKGYCLHSTAPAKWTTMAYPWFFDIIQNDLNLEIERPTEKQKIYGTQLFNGNRFCVIKKPEHLTKIAEFIPIEHERQSKNIHQIQW